MTIKVRWLDSGMFLEHGWSDIATYQRDASLPAMEVTTIGHYMFEDADVLAVALSKDQQGRWYGVQIIAKSAILERTALSDLISRALDEVSK